MAMNQTIAGIMFGKKNPPTQLMWYFLMEYVEWNSGIECHVFLLMLASVYEEGMKGLNKT
jgi:hypothetical protein